MTRFIDAYAVLEVNPTATTDELKAARRRLARRYHPDLAPTDRRAEATRAVQEVNVAYGLVRDPESRAEYDRIRRAYLAGRAVSGEWDELARSAGRWAGRQWAQRPSMPDSAFKLGRRVGRWLR